MTANPAARRECSASESTWNKDHDPDRSKQTRNGEPVTTSWNEENDRTTCERCGESIVYVRWFGFTVEIGPEAEAASWNLPMAMVPSDPLTYVASRIGTSGAFTIVRISSDTDNRVVLFGSWAGMKGDPVRMVIVPKNSYYWTVER